MPCSPEMVPPSSTESLNVSETHSRARAISSGIVAVNDEVDVDVAVAGMAEIGDEHVVTFCRSLRSCNEFGTRERGTTTSSLILSVPYFIRLAR